jgi:1,4-dihydroxy-2-naphthoate polyprenyltransferase
VVFTSVKRFGFCRTILTSEMAPRKRAGSLSSKATPMKAQEASAQSATLSTVAPSVAPRANLTFKDKASWMPPRARELIAATRPWSVPASFIPAVLTCFVVWPRALSLLHCLLPAFAVVFVHLGANCLNTLGDYASGVDTVEHADDRALVEKRVSLRSLAIIAGLLFATGGCIALYYALYVIVGHNGLLVAAAALLLGFFYTTSNPTFSLKHYGLGDTIVGLCFGPLLMLGVSFAATGSDAIDTAVLLFSLPIMLLTINILHANNTRDLSADRKAGAFTVARFVAENLGFSRGNVYLYAFNLAAAFVLAIGALAYTLTRSYLNAGLPFHSTSHGLQATQTTLSVLGACVSNADWKAFLTAGGAFTGFGVCDAPSTLAAMEAAAASSAVAVAKGDAQRYLAAGQHFVRAAVFLVTTCLPWAVALCRRFSAGLRGQSPGLKELPQASAQFNLLFGGALLSGLLSSQAFARALLGLLFYLGGVNNILMFGHSARLIRYKFTSSGLLPGLSLYGAGFLLAVATLMQLCASVTLMVGYEVKASALVLIAFLWPVTGVIHNFWDIDVEEEDNGEGKEGKRGGSKKAKDKKKDDDDDEEEAVNVDFAVPTFLTAFDAEFVAYFKNALVLGGLSVLLAYL